jgi:hypothetical protein
MFPTSLQLLAKTYNCTGGNGAYMIILFYLSEIKLFREEFEIAT